VAAASATLSTPLSLDWVNIYANHPWLVTEPETIGVPGWQTGQSQQLLLISE